MIRFQITGDDFLLSNLSPSRALPQALLTVLFGFFFIMTVSRPASAKPSYAIRPPQPWVRILELESQTKSGSSPASSSFLLDDHQIRVGEKTVERYYHHVQRIETAAGLSDVSQLKFYFEPSYQQLAIHFIRIHRDRGLIDALKPSEIKVIQQEEDLKQQLYNGTLAALIFLNDLRVGDIVDYAYTVSGENPVLGGFFSDTFYLANRQPIQHLKLRLVVPSDRVITISNANIEVAPTVSKSGNESEYTWERRDIDALNIEDSTPQWFDPYPSVPISEFQTWSDVVRWALPLYTATGVTPELKTIIQKWQSESESPEGQTVAALRFVQDEIRYLGIELGRYSHQPTLPATVFARRFGDCKDKSLLLVSILKSMGIDAAPALVDTRAGRSLDKRQPSPFAFDHAIVQVRLNGKTYWLDPTIGYQRGGLAQYYDPSYERALVLREGATDLEKIPLPAVNSGQVRIWERYEGTTRGVVTLLVHTTYVGSEADNTRSFLSGYSLAELSKLYLNFYSEESPSIKADGLPQIDDDPITNTVQVKEKYLIDGFWKDNKHYFHAERIYSEIGKPSSKQRSMPLRVRFPLSIEHTIEIDLVEKFNISPDQGRISNEAVWLDYSFRKEGELIELEYSFKTLADFIPVEKVPSHLMVLDRIHNALGYQLTNGPSVTDTTPGRGKRRDLFIALGLIVLVPLILIGLGLLIWTRLKGRSTSQFGKAIMAKVGFTPETAFRVNHEDDIEAALREFKCSCGQCPYQSDSPPAPERFTYDGKHLVGVGLKCAACGRKNDLYFHAGSNQTTDSPTFQTN